MFPGSFDLPAEAREVSKAFEAMREHGEACQVCENKSLCNTALALYEAYIEVVRRYSVASNQLQSKVNAL